MINTILHGNCLELMRDIPDSSVDMCITSPPYWRLRDYGIDGQIGLEETIEEYINKLCDIFDESYRILKPEGSCWVNLGDTYMNNSSYSNKGRQEWGNDKVGMIYKKHAVVKRKSLCLIPERFAIEMVNRGWILRNEIIWYKRNVTPSSVKDRYTVDYEKLFFFVKQEKYYFKQQLEPLAESSIKAKNAKLNQTTHIGASNNSVNVQLGCQARGERFVPSKGRNKRCVWDVVPKGFQGAHFAVFPEDLIESPIDACCPKGGLVFDPFMGSGTTGVVATKQRKNYLGIELNSEYIEIAEARIKEYTVQQTLISA